MLVAFILSVIIGADPASYAKYEASIDLSALTFTCFDGTKVISLDRLNDNYLDCPDGSDEPGTSASPEKYFYCRNEGSVPSSIQRWSVGDGHCDCCDGSDEAFDFCPNTCGIEEAERQSILSILETAMQSGLDVVNEMRENGTRSVNQAKNQTKICQAKIKDLEDEIDFLENRTNWGTPTPAPSNGDQPEILNPLHPPGPGYTPNPTSLYEKHHESFKEFVTGIWNFTFRADKSKPKPPKDTGPKMPESFRERVNQARVEKSRTQDELRKYERLQNFNTSNDFALASLFEEEFKWEKYTLKCFDQMKQDYTNAGKYADIVGDEMIYQSGSHCWQTKTNRQTRVKMICWNETKLTYVNEPQMCQYRAYLATPAICSIKSINSIRNLTLPSLKHLQKQLGI